MNESSACFEIIHEVHSDQGCHYTSYAFIDVLRDKKLRQSMSRRANCWDNAPQESFYGHMKDHIGDLLIDCKTFENVKDLIDDYIDYHNNERYQWKLAKLAPTQYYKYCITGIYPLDVHPPGSTHCDKHSKNTRDRDLVVIRKIMTDSIYRTSIKSG